ncbi:hypothetical protein, partial [Solimicrobium silvestre]|uniref:hypothetical protein n=1 Tax=Solimicrobium silvestre TaxID=2099400 RepID=UPI001A9C3529
DARITSGPEQKTAHLSGRIDTRKLTYWLKSNSSCKTGGVHRYRVESSDCGAENGHSNPIDSLRHLLDTRQR